MTTLVMNRPDVESSDTARPVGPNSLVRDLARSTSAELFRLRRWPATWVISAAWLLLVLTFGYILNYVSFSTGESGFSNDSLATDSLLTELLPASVPTIFLQGLPMFGGALMMVLGAMTAGNGYGWGTWKTVYTQGPTRTTVSAGSLVALVIWAVAVLAVTVAVCFGAANLIAAIESQPLGFAPMGELVEAFGSALLITVMWLFLGYLLGVLTRSPAMSVGLGVVWAVVVENMLRGVGGSIEAIATLTEWLPGTAAGALVGALFGPEGDGAPGINTLVSQSHATWVLAGYAVFLPLIALIVIRRRDVS